MIVNPLRNSILAALSIVALAAAPVTAQEKKTIGSIKRIDPRIDRLVPAGAVMEKLAEGFDWSEGPVWDRRGGFLVFSDVPMNTVFKWKEGDTSASVFLKPSGYTGKAPRGGEPGSNGLLRDSEGRLVLCQHGDRRVARLEANGTFTTLADRYDGKRFNSPNDGVYKSNGDLYFTDPPYGLLGLNNDPKKEIPFNGVYRIAKDGTVTLLTKEMTFPNGIAFSPDEKTLYVANSDPNLAIWKAFDVKDDGTLGPGRLFYDATPWAKEGRKGLPDGMKVDKSGNLFATAPGGVAIFASDGTHLGTLNTGEATANCGWGDDGLTLYITADMYLCRIRLTTQGPGFASNLLYHKGLDETKATQLAEIVRNAILAKESSKWLSWLNQACYAIRTTESGWTVRVNPLIPYLGSWGFFAEMDRNENVMICRRTGGK